MAEGIDHEKVKATLGKLIDVLRDSHQGYLELEKHIKDPAARTFFLQESQVRANYSGELENELHRLGVKDVEQSGMLSGRLHRAWGELKANLGGGDHALLNAADKGEIAAKTAYETALSEHLPADIRELLTAHHTHVLEAHGRMLSFRDAKA